MLEFTFFTDDKEKQRRLDICKGTANKKPCEHYRKEFTFLWIFKLKTAQCNDCGCPIINRITVLNPHCTKHD